jgi:hypothetical protein
MKKCIKLIMGGSLMFSSVIQAEIIGTDWLIEGDQHAFVDTQTGVEWLRMGTPRQAQGISSLGSTTIANIDILFPGWRFPTMDELLAVGENILVNSPSAKSIFTGNLNAAPATGAVPSRAVYGNSRVYAGANYSLTPWMDAFGWTPYANGGQSSSMYFYNGNGAIGVGMYDGRGAYQQITRGYSRGDLGSYSFGSTNNFFLVSDGGVTLSSQLDPSLNANNANSPVVGDVSAPAIALCGLTLLGLGFVRRRA